MVGIQGLGGIPEPKPERPAKLRNEGEKPTSGVLAASQAPAQDDLKISSEAQAAAEVARIIQTSLSQEEVRIDRVEAARERIERGDYKNPEVVAKVAEKISRLL
ncbi:MAG: flagellar biosynthesis anti-sigma factor FlgM [Candidatus Hydrogenedentes bacterium]|nr:flagellar biosynthesis anti-sigma factor FlgM [Candidatus Hydrogenedentota bacterium]MBI3119857.1 flagellar biosynthesis anti-sigma factor FlgM [Candidatus Hydrogenedentota bacterium]